jgi:hypothetical protein
VMVVVSGALSLWLIKLPLELRSLGSHGIKPYLQALPQVISEHHQWAATAQNLLISFALIGETAFSRPFPARDLFVSLSPLPGQVAGWYEVAPYHRLNLYTPTAGLGELGNAGWVATIIVSFLIGFALAWIEIRSKTLLATGKQLIGLALITFSALFFLFFVQYNLRSAIRFLYYGLALDLLASLFRLKRPGTPVEKTNRNGRRGFEFRPYQRATELSLEPKAASDPGITPNVGPVPGSGHLD